MAGQNWRQSGKWCRMIVERMKERARKGYEILWSICFYCWYSVTMIKVCGWWDIKILQFRVTIREMGNEFLSFGRDSCPRQYSSVIGNSEEESSTVQVIKGHWFFCDKILRNSKEIRMLNRLIIKLRPQRVI